MSTGTWPSDVRLKEPGRRMEGHVADVLRAVHERYLGLRLFGIVALAVGPVCRHLPYLHSELANAYQIAASGPAAAP